MKINILLEPLIKWRLVAIAICLLGSFVLSGDVFAQDRPQQPDKSIDDTSSLLALDGFPGLPIARSLPNNQGGEDYTITIQLLLLMTSLTFLPAMLLGLTAFTRIIVVLAILRQALGLQQTPSNQILLGLALFLTFYVMQPVFSDIYQNAVLPYMNESVSSTEGVEIASLAIKEFMLSQIRESDLSMFMRVSNTQPVAHAIDVPFSVLVPAFLTSELKTAFQIGFLLFVPFLVIDLVVASVLMAMGMVMLSPIIVSLPFKIMLFVLVDGWAMISSSLVSSFGI